MATTSTKIDHVNSSRGTWEFWIDVGGTFTDCLARREDGLLLRHKLLSSGVTKGVATRIADSFALRDAARRNDPDDFWTGYELRLLDNAGQVLAGHEVTGFDATTGTFRLAVDRSTDIGNGVAADISYELASDEPAPLVAIRYLMRLPLAAEIPRITVRLGTTRGTNALLTRSGAKTALVTTCGFGDVLHIGNQDRPRLFELDIKKRVPLFVEVLEVDERVTHDGQVLVTPDVDALRADLVDLKRRGIDSLAICLLNSYAHPRHEQLVEDAARQVGFCEVRASHVATPVMKLVARGDTTVVDAYLTPVLREYIAMLRARLGDSELRLMTSAGGLVSAEEFSGKDSILSGPAGGVVGFARAAEAIAAGDASGQPVRAIGFDMGGTSTDVARYEGAFPLHYEADKAGVRIVTPMMAIETVAAGGGSCCGFDGVKLIVGPESAGADPGPACYGRGGPLTVTDVNLVLGKILPRHFPFPLEVAAAHDRLQDLCDRIGQATGTTYTPFELADGFLRVANANMAEAIRTISIAEGVDPRKYILVAFGGAAGQHACAVAGELGIRKILLHPDAGILSARGLGLADVTRHAVAGIYRPFESDVVESLEAIFARLATCAREQVQAEGIVAKNLEEHRSLDLRYQGLDSYLTVRSPADGDYVAAYEREHERLYGYRHVRRPLEVVTARVEVVGRCSEAAGVSQRAVSNPATSKAQAIVYFQTRSHDTAVYRRSELRAGDAIRGPAIVFEDNSTIVVDPGWQGEVYTGGELLLTPAETPSDQVVVAEETGRNSTESDPVMLEVFNNQFAAIAKQMGITLQNTATSVNVKERLDYSCAIFTPAGDLVVNAPHIPVHLGAMSVTVRRAIADNPTMAPGDVFVTNDPYRGGSHLPDITVVTPMFDESGSYVIFFTASRAHHAEIGGIEPGSMPPGSCNLSEEGVLIRNFKLIDAGQPRYDSLRKLLINAPYPSRSADDNIADLAAQVAANNQGERDLQRLIDRYTFPVVRAYTEHIQRAAETKMRSALAARPDGRTQFIDYLDYVDGDGATQSARIEVALTISGDEAIVDFSGTDGVLPNNLNANRAIVMAAVMYVMRCLIDEDIPLNEGVLAPVELVLPECLLNPSEQAQVEDCPAVVGGNVETSQRVVDVLLGALGIAAASQGTMNNVLFGDNEFGYYETICGGSGATKMSPGADAVHTHMTNTRLTDPEVLEHVYPVRVLEFSIRDGSGGDGRMRGGDGVIRRLEFLRPLDVSLLTTRRGPNAPFGVSGGGSGALGKNFLTRANKTSEELPAQAKFHAEVGDVLTIKTPGGGGYGDSKGACE